MKYDVTAYRPGKGDFLLLGVVEAPDHLEAHAEACRRWPREPAHRVFCRRQGLDADLPSRGAQVAPGGPTDQGEDN